MQTPEKFIRLRELQPLIGLKKASVYRKLRAGTFPRPIKIGDRAIAWRASDVAQWQASREAA